MGNGEPRLVAKVAASLAGWIGAGVAGLLLGRLAIGPLLFLVNSHRGFEEQVEWVEWWCVGILSAIAAAPFGAIGALLWMRHQAQRR
jgi:hypothetical protein